MKLLSVEITGDSATLQTAARQAEAAIDRLGATAGKAQQPLDRLGSTADGAAAAMGDVGGAADRATPDVEALGRAATTTGTAVEAIQRGTTPATAAIGAAGRQAEQAATQLQAFGGALSRSAQPAQAVQASTSALADSYGAFAARSARVDEAMRANQAALAATGASFAAFGPSAAGAGAQAEAVGAKAGAAGGAFRAMRGTVQQAGFQLQDFFVQVQSGQSAITAFVQQGSQILGAFGPGGAIAGAALAIGGVALNMAQARRDTDQTDEAAKKLARSLSDLRDIVTGVRTESDGVRRNLEASVAASARLAEQRAQTTVARQAEQLFTTDGAGNVILSREVRRPVPGQENGDTAEEIERNRLRASRPDRLEPLLIRAEAGLFGGGEDRALARSRPGAPLTGLALDTSNADSKTASAQERGFTALLQDFDTRRGTNAAAGLATVNAILGPEEAYRLRARQIGEALSTVEGRIAELERGGRDDEAAALRALFPGRDAIEARLALLDPAAQRVRDLRDELETSRTERSLVDAAPGDRADALARLARRQDLQREGIDVTTAAAQAEIALAGAVARSGEAAQQAAARTGRLRDLRDEQARQALRRDTAEQDPAAQAEAAARLETRLRLIRETGEATSAAARAEIDFAGAVARTGEETDAAVRQTQRLRDLRDQLAVARAERGLVQAPAGERAATLAQLQTELRLRREGVDLTSARAQEEIGLARQVAVVTEETRRQQAVFADFASSIEGGFNGVKQAVVEAFVQGRSAAVTFGSVTRGVLTQILAQLIQLQTINPFLNGLIGGNRATLSDVGGLIGRLFTGGGTPSPTQGMSVAEIAYAFPLYHSGGVAGGPAAMRTVDPAIFSGARRYHGGGLAGDEVPAILRRGEGVFTPEQMAALGGLGGGRVEVHVLNEGGGRVETSRERGPGGAETIRVWIRQEVAAAIAGGGTDEAMGARFGLRRAGLTPVR